MACCTAWRHQGVSGEVDGVITVQGQVHDNRKLWGTTRNILVLHGLYASDRGREEGNGKGQEDLWKDNGKTWWLIIGGHTHEKVYRNHQVDNGVCNRHKH